LHKALIKVIAVVVEAVEEVEAVKKVEVEIAIKAGANIEVEDAAVEVKEEVTIALIISYYH
jgi:hypothetical protein